MKSIIRLGDTRSCPVLGYISCTLSTCSPRHTIRGGHIVFSSDRLSSSAKLISNFSHLSTKILHLHAFGINA